ncbi:Vitamin K epoxide reductase family protein [anaerobic digester metagenome]
METNIFISFLDSLKVKYTRFFSNQFFNEHPHKYNLFGLSSMLSDYGIENVGLKISNIDDLCLIETPFIAHIKDDFVIIEKILENEICFSQRNKSTKISLEEFSKIWTGNILVAEPDKDSIEPEYKKHYRIQFFKYLQKTSILLIVFFLLFISFIQNKSCFYLGLVLLLLINLIGVCIGYLLVLKQLNIQSNYGDKICSLFKHSDCNNILESDAAKLFGVFSWSEIGLGYFIANTLFICFFPSYIPYLALINILCLPYTFWSIWYQKFKTRQWCPLCLIVIALLWILFVINLIFGFFFPSHITFLGLIITSFVYAISILSANLVLSILMKSLQVESINYEINNIKADEDVFKSLLKKQPYYVVARDTSSILLGNLNSKFLITIFTNPHCNPCAKMHKRVNDLLNKNGNLCVQYVFSSFNKELDISNKFLIGIYQQNNGETRLIYDKWFEKGKYNKETFFQKYSVKLDEASVNKEFELHEQWKEKSGLRATPTILINGYKLPENFKIEDMQFLNNIEI